VINSFIDKAMAPKMENHVSTPPRALQGTIKKTEKQQKVKQSENNRKNDTSMQKVSVDGSALRRGLFRRLSDHYERATMFNEWDQV
jgi:hypothetical protein